MNVVRFLRIAGYVSVAASVLCGVMLFAARKYWHQLGGFPVLLEVLHVFLFLAVLAMPLVCGVLGVLTLVLAVGFGRADRGTLLKSSGFFALTCVLAVAVLRALPAGMPVPRRAEFVAVAEAGQPLIEAIRRYELDHASPPPALTSLVPGYLSAIPDTGHPVYRAFEYQHRPSELPSGVTWALWVDCSSLFQFDTFFYWPTEDYSLHYEPRSIERIGRWAYHHE